MQFSDSDQYYHWKRAQDCIAQGALTNSKHPDRHVFGVYPTHISHGNGAFLYDHRGNKFVDYICGLGVNLFGYAFPRHLEAVSRAMRSGFSHSLPTHFEIEAAEALKEMFYFVDKWKFLKTGSEACNAAIRIARAHTNRNLILSEGYHGWGDDFLSLSPPANGVPIREGILRLGSSGDVDLDNVGGVIIEPVVDLLDDDRIRWLNKLREKCTKAGALLIFDEVITGFRFKNHCVAQASGVIPDLFIIGKASAQGMPLAAVGGKREVMDGDYFVSSTYAGEILSLAAVKATVETLTKVSEFKIDRLWEAGERFVEKFNKVAEGCVELRAYPTRGTFVGEDLNKALLFQEACKAGILLGPSWFYSFANMAYDDFFFTFLSDFMRRFRLGELTLAGKMPTSPFSQRLRDGRTS